MISKTCECQKCNTTIRVLTTADNGKKLKVKYISIGRPIQIKEFEMYAAPTGWIRKDILKRRLKTESWFRDLFTKDEIKELS